MILSRVTKHFRQQHWTAVCLDFAIVVAGVFLGLQVNNWNETRGDRAEYERALGRLRAEIDTNLATLDALGPSLQQDLRNVGIALDILQTCQDSEENRRLVTLGLGILTHTYGLHLRHSALEEVATSPRLLSQESEAERKRFTDLLYYYGIASRDSEQDERFPENTRFENNPIIGLGAPQKISALYFGIDYTKNMRPLVLKAPIDQACQNDALIKSLFDWERKQNNIPVLVHKLRVEFESTKAVIEAHQ